MTIQLLTKQEKSGKILILVLKEILDKIDFSKNKWFKFNNRMFKYILK